MRTLETMYNQGYRDGYLAAVEQTIEAWHKGGTKLHEALGWTWEEYKHWVETSELPERSKPDGSE